MSTKRDDVPVTSPPTVTPSLGQPPPYPQPPLPDFDARTHGLRALAQWCSSLRYMRTMAPGQPAQEFAITPDRVFVEQPDAIENLQFPCIAFLPGRGQYMTRGLGGADIIEAPDLGPGAAFVIPYDYQETFTLQGWGSKISERRSIVAAIEVAIATYQGTTDLRLIMPDYFGLVAEFAIMERENLDDPEVQKGRRRVNLMIQMLVPIVREVRLPGLIGPFVNVNVGDATGRALISGEGPAGLASLTARLRASDAAPDATLGLAVFRLTVDSARAIARATLGLTMAESMALTTEYLLAVVQGLAAEAASYETQLGRPPYSPGSNPARDLLDRLRPRGSP